MPDTNKVDTVSSDILEMYKMWLSGLSIRKIANIYSIGRMAVWGQLTRKYGISACSPKKQSLARVAYREYGDLELAMRARGIEGSFISQKTEDNYTRCQTKEVVKDNQVYTEDAFEPALLGFYFMTLVDTIADGVAEVYASALIDAALSGAD